MIKIAFCDDDVTVVQQMSVLMECYREKKSCELEYAAYHSPLELMASIEKGFQPDILFLDIMMPGQSGMNLAKEIRILDDRVQIVFLTSSPEFAIESYSVGASFYQLKPITKENLFPVLDKVISKCCRDEKDTIVLKCRTGITAVTAARIQYCEVIGRTLMLHLDNKTVLECTGKLDELENRLSPFGGFYRVHRSYLVNLSYIQNISYKSLLLGSGAEIPVPHGKYNEIKKAYLDYAFEKDWVTL